MTENTLIERLRAEKTIPDKRPTIAELEAILAQPDPPTIQILPDGSITAGEGNLINPDGPEAATVTAGLVVERDRLREALAAIAGPPERDPEKPPIYEPRWAARQCRDIARTALET